MEAYKIGMSIMLSNGVSGVLATIAKDILGVEGGIKRLQHAFDSLNRTSLAIGGAIGVAGGVGILAGLKKIADHGDKLLDQQDKLRRAGIQQNEVLKLQADYYARIAKAVPTSTVSEYLKTVNELRAVTGSTQGAAALAERALKVDALLGNTFGKEMSGEYYKLLRSAEMKGISTDPAKLANFTDKAFSYITAFGGKLSANDFQLMARRGGTAFMNADIDKSMGPLAVLAADLGGSGAGTTLMTLQQMQMGANTLSKQQGEILEKAGLLDMSKVTKTGFGGGRLQVEAGGILGSMSHKGDLPGWIREVVYPAILKMAKGDDVLAQSYIAKMFPNRNAAKLVEMFGNPHFLDQQQKDLGLAGQVKPIDQAYADYIKSNPKGAKAAFHEQYESMMQSIGAPLMQAAIPVMKSITEFFTEVGKFANEHPDAIANIGKGFAVLGAALIGGGGVALLAALGPVGWFAAGILALGGVFVAFKDQLAGLADSVAKMIPSASEAAAALKEFGNLIKGFFGGLVDWVKEKLGGLFSHTNLDGGGSGGYGGNIIKASLGSANDNSAAIIGGSGAAVTPGAIPHAASANVSGFNPVFAGRLANMMAAAKAAGVPLSVFSGYRSQAHQNALFAHSDGSGHWVARHSNHTRGIAADLRGNLGWAHAHAHEFGLKFPMPWEKWHIEPQESRGGRAFRHIKPYSKPTGSGHQELVVKLDGEVIHRSVVNHERRATEHSHQAPTFDGYHDFSAPDGQIWAA